MTFPTQEAVFCWENLVDAEATVISCAGTDNPLWPVANLKRPELDLPFRTSSTTLPNDATVIFDFGSTKSWQVLALPLHTLRSSGTVSVAKSADGVNWTAVVNSDPTLALDTWPNGGQKRNMYVCLADAVQSSRYVRFIAIDAGHPDPYFEFARACIGPVVTPGINMDWGFQMGVVDGTKVIETTFGSPHALAAPRSRWHRYTFDKKLTKAEARKFSSELQYGLGLGGDLLAIPYPQDTSYWWWENVWGKPTEYNVDPTHAAVNRWSFGFRVKERLA